MGPAGESRTTDRQPGEAPGIIARIRTMRSSFVVRFCQRLGLRGYQALKLAIASEVGAGNSSAAPRIQAEDSPPGVLPGPR
ncbi:hypothetical protein ACFOY2_17390 [Nonomuraea purpurea]|uniref:HTH rpiR-type domain-containing protein n=1 Tax=Nonomuraea purpurea TaxID=1849276 RepID=A0ABV8G867_9ACTN